MQYAAAKTLGARVPEEALVVELGVDTKNLYYYPKSTRLVVGVDPDVNEDLMNRIGIETGTPVLPRSAPIAGKAVMDGETVWGQRAGTVDCVVSTGRLEKLSGDEVETVAKKTAMALRPGGRYVFVEPAGGNRGQALFDALEATGAFESPIHSTNSGRRYRCFRTPSAWRLKRRPSRRERTRRSPFRVVDDDDGRRPSVHPSM